MKWHHRKPNLSVSVSQSHTAYFAVSEWYLKMLRKTIRCTQKKACFSKQVGKYIYKVPYCSHNVPTLQSKTPTAWNNLHNHKGQSDFFPQEADNQFSSWSTLHRHCSALWRHSLMLCLFSFEGSFVPPHFALVSPASLIPLTIFTKTIIKHILSKKDPLLLQFRILFCQWCSAQLDGTKHDMST